MPNEPSTGIKVGSTIHAVCFEDVTVYPSPWKEVIENDLSKHKQQSSKNMLIPFETKVIMHCFIDKIVEDCFLENLTSNFCQ